MKGLAMPLNSEFMGNPDDGFVTLNYLMQEPAKQNLATIMYHIGPETKIAAKILVAENQPMAVRMKGNGISLLGARFKELADINSEKQPRLDLEPAYATEDSLATAKEEKIHLPRQGQSLYLALEDNFAKELESSKNPDVKVLLNQLAVIFHSKNFHITRQNGYLVIFNTSERAGSYLTTMAANIHRATQGKTKAFIGQGNITHKTGRAAFEMKDFPPEALHFFHFSQQFKHRLTGQSSGNF